MRYFVANWKMNKTRESARAFITRFRELYRSRSDQTVILCPPATLLPLLSDIASDLPEFSLGGQNIHWETKGAFTGELSSEQLLDFGVRFALTGHSERYIYNGESPEVVAKRALAAVNSGIRPVICVGEQRADFESHRSAEVVTSQLERSLSLLDPIQGGNIIVAYEPIWAIGTGLAADPESASKVRETIRRVLNSRFGEEFGSGIPIIYGGSTNPGNVLGFLEQGGFNGVLPGASSLDPDTLCQMCDA